MTLSLVAAWRVSTDTSGRSARLRAAETRTGIRRERRLATTDIRTCPPVCPTSTRCLIPPYSLASYPAAYPTITVTRYFPMAGHLLLSPPPVVTGGLLAEEMG